jgi:ribonucleoside-diphosphate reductase beta chain
LENSRNNLIKKKQQAMGIFDKRISYKPFEYPEVLQFVEAINKSFWVHSEIDFTADVQDFHSNLEPYEQNAVKHALLAIAQIEVAVKTFWGNLYNHMPKPELNGLELLLQNANSVIVRPILDC